MAIARGWGLPLQGALAAACLLAAPAAVCSDTWFVAVAGDDTHDCLAPATPCATIQGAIAKAASGDSIRVRAETFLGTEDEVVLVDRDLELSGGWNEGFTLQTGSTIVDGENTRTGILVEATASMELFVVQHGVPGPSSAGGVSNYGTLTMTRCTVQDNQGSGVRNEGTLVVDASTVSGNSSNSGAGGIVNFFFSSLILNNSTVSGNHSTSEGGGLSVGAGTVSLNSTTVTNNSADFGGGGVRNRTGGTLELQNSLIAGNTAPFAPDCWDPAVGTLSQKATTSSETPLCVVSPLARGTSSGSPRGSVPSWTTVGPPAPTDPRWAARSSIPGIRAAAPTPTGRCSKPTSEASPGRRGAAATSEPSSTFRPPTSTP
jgi:hypothetical protein